MKLYLSIIGIAMVLIAVPNIVFGVAPWYYVLAAVLWCVVLLFALDGLIAILIRLTPDRYYGIENPHFS